MDNTKINKKIRELKQSQEMLKIGALFERDWDKSCRLYEEQDKSYKKYVFFLEMSDRLRGK